jgi:hypothetical protein
VTVSPADVLTYGVLAFMGVRLVGGMRSSRSRQGRVLVRDVVVGIRFRHVWPLVVVLPVVVAVANLLIAVPGLDWGWWTMIGGDGNPVFGSSDATIGTMWEWIIPLAFMTLLIPALPLFAYTEERMFRTGAEHWSLGRRAWKVLQFGMIHALIGIPIGAALALSLGGAYFMTVYLRDFRISRSRYHATLESTRAHTVYNAVIVALVVTFAIMLALA